MKNIYHLLSIIPLLCVLALVSCEDDKIVNENIGSVDEVELTDYTLVGSIEQATPIVRANLQESGYVWEQEDKITLWNRNRGVGYNFAITAAYDGSQPSKEVEFTGKAIIDNGHKLLAVFPKREAQSFGELTTFTMPEVCVQAGEVAELASTTYMAANGNMEDGKISMLTFSPLTALLKLGLTNTSDSELKIRSLTVICNEAVFPLELEIDEDGSVRSLSEIRDKLTLDMGEQPLVQGAMLNGYINIFPTTYGNTQLMKGSTEMTITANVLRGEIEEHIVLLKKVQIDDLQSRCGLNMEATAYQFAAGRLYQMGFDVDYRFKVPEEGYLVDDNSDIHIYNAKGLREWNKIAGDYRTATVTLEKEYIEADGDGVRVIDLNDELWEPITAFNGVFEGNGVTIRNLKIKNKGFIGGNTGTISNLTLENVSFEGDVIDGAGGLIAESTGGAIINCTIKNITATVKNTTVFGGLVGRSGECKIEGCKVLSGTITIDLAGKPNNSNYGGLVGELFNGTSLIANSFVGEELTINHPTNAAGASTLGGLVGWNNLGKIKGCYSLATLNVNCSAQTGGLIGANSNGLVMASYAAGAITGALQNNTGGFIGSNTINSNVGIISCYSTTTITASGGTLGAFVGKHTTGTNQCYFVGSIDAVGNGSTDGIAKLQSATEMQAKKRPMNLAIEAFEPDFQFGFKVNTDAGTADKQPLIFQQDVSEPGFEGPDFGDGGDI